MSFPLSFPIQFGGGSPSSGSAGTLEALRRAGGANAAELGSDISTFPDFDTTYSLMTPRRSIAEGVARRFITPKGTLWAHPSYGEDLRRYLNAPMTSQALQDLKAKAEAEAEQDERVLGCTVLVSFDDETKTINLKVLISDGDGPFEFSAAISSLGIADFQVQE